MINSSWFRQVRRDQRTSKTYIRIFARNDFRRNVIIRYVGLNMAGRVSRLTSSLQEMTTAARSTSNQRTKIIPSIRRVLFRRNGRLSFTRRNVNRIRAIRFGLAKTIIIRILAFFRLISRVIVRQAIKCGFRHTSKINCAFGVITLSVNGIMRKMNFPLTSYTVIFLISSPMSSEIARVRIKVNRVGFNTRRRKALLNLATIRFIRRDRVFFCQPITVEAKHAQLYKYTFLFYGLLTTLFIGMNFSFRGRSSNGIPRLLRMIKYVMSIFPFRSRPLSIFLSNFRVFHVLLSKIYVVWSRITCASIFFYRARIRTSNFNVASVRVAIKLKQRTNLRASSILAILRIFRCGLFRRVRTFLFQ